MYFVRFMRLRYAENCLKNNHLKFRKPTFFLFLCNLKNREVAEWSKAHAWKVCILHKGIVGSNPILSAKALVERFFYLRQRGKLAFQRCLNKKSKP